MAVSPKFPPLQKSSKAITASDSKHLVSIPVKTKPNSKTVVTLPIQAPLWLSNLCWWQDRASFVTFSLIVTTLGVYGWTVYCQQTWSQTYRRLVTLQRNEQQLTTKSEQIKDYLALQAQQPATGLTPPNPAQTIFLPTSDRPNTPVSPTNSTQKTQLIPTPLGY